MIYSEYNHSCPSDTSTRTRISRKHEKIFKLKQMPIGNSIQLLEALSLGRFTVLRFLANLDLLQSGGLRRGICNLISSMREHDSYCSLKCCFIQSECNKNLWSKNLKLPISSSSNQNVVQGTHICECRLQQQKAIMKAGE